MSYERGMWPEALMALIATVAAAWPISALLSDSEWVGPAVLIVALVAMVGGLLRGVGAPPGAVVAGQLVAALAALMGGFLRETLWYGLPTPDTVELAASLVREAGRVLQSYAAPAPATAGVQFLVVLLMALTAICVDAIGVTNRSPAIAGLPLMAVFLVSVSNTGEAMQPQFFIAVAAAWLAMVAQQGNRLVGGWPSADRREMVGSHDVSHGPTGHRTLARMLGVVTLAAALLAASLLPHLPPTFFGEGLARNSEGNDLSPGGSVSFTDTMDLAADLNSQSNEIVIRYKSSAYPLPPLRVTAAQEYDGQSWLPPSYPDLDETGQGPTIELPRPAGLSPDVATTVAEIDVLQSGLKAPHIATPWPLVSAQLGVDGAYDPATEAVRVAAPADGYRASFLQVAPRGQLPDSIGATKADPADFDPDLLAVDPAAAPAVGKLADEIVGGATNDLEIASLIQNHLHSGPYRYSLTLVPGGDPNDPITHFLETRQGFCVQFATAMVMMARHEGIPARMAVGFLPGVNEDGVMTVRQANAHAWPELWISGLGWTRFEPTPGSHAGPVPNYSNTQEGTSAPEQTVANPTTVATPTPTKAAPAPQTDTSIWDGLGALVPSLAKGALVLLVLALFMALVPLAGKRYREAGLRRAETATDQVEGQWDYLTRSLDDYGVPPPGERSPREMRSHYSEVTRLDHRGGEALGRVTATLERSRYAPGSVSDPKTAEKMGRDVRSVIESVTEDLPWNIRLNSRLLPRSGMREIRSMLTRWRR